MVIEIDTEDSTEYRYFPVVTKALRFSVRAPHDVHVALNSIFNTALYTFEVIIGKHNSKCIIRKQEDDTVVEHETPCVLDRGEFRQFWITFCKQTVAMGFNGDRTPVLVWNDPRPFRVTRFGIKTTCGAFGSWKIENDWCGWREISDADRIAVSPDSAGNGSWVRASGGHVPPNATPGGFEYELMYIGRANHGGGLIPGKVQPKKGLCFVCWNGKQHGVPEYEVLCDCSGTWVFATGRNIPPNAIVGGFTEEGEALYIGRCYHNGTITVGKVQRSHGACYIAHGGIEISKNEYEILVDD